MLGDETKLARRTINVSNSFKYFCDVDTLEGPTNPELTCLFFILCSKSSLEKIFTFASRFGCGRQTSSRKTWQSPAAKSHLLVKAKFKHPLVFKCDIKSSTQANRPFQVTPNFVDGNDTIRWIDTDCRRVLACVCWYNSTTDRTTI